MKKLLTVSSLVAALALSPLGFAAPMCDNMVKKHLHFKGGQRITVYLPQAEAKKLTKTPKGTFAPFNNATLAGTGESATATGYGDSVLLE